MERNSEIERRRFLVKPTMVVLTGERSWIMMTGEVEVSSGRRQQLEEVSSGMKYQGQTRKI